MVPSGTASTDISRRMACEAKALCWPAKTLVSSATVPKTAAGLPTCTCKPMGDASSTQLTRGSADIYEQATRAGKRESARRMCLAPGISKGTHPAGITAVTVGRLAMQQISMAFRIPPGPLIQTEAILEFKANHYVWIP